MSGPRTREVLKQEVLDYISHQASAPNPRLERLTIPAIADIVLESDLDRVRQAVNDLQTDHQARSITVVQEIILPESDAGKRIRRDIASRMRMGRHTYVAIAVTLVALYFAFPYLLKEDAPIIVPPYTSGPSRSFMWFVVGGGFLIYLLDEAITRFRIFQIVSEETYADLGRITKYSVALLVLLYVGCYLVFRYVGWEMSASVAVAILIGSVTISIGLFFGRRTAGD